MLLDLFGFHREPERPGAKDPAPPRPRPAASATPAPARAATPAVRDEAAVLAIARGAGARFRRLVFTRNRRVMASVADGVAELRLNAAFATAPDAVLVAVAVLFSTRDGRRRRAARATVRRFIAQIPQGEPAPPVRRQRRVSPHDRPHLERLQAEFDRVNAGHFAGELPRVPLFLSGQMRRRNGHFSAHPLEIVLSRRLCTHGDAGESEQTLRHEMVHLWQHATGRPVNHGLEFRRMARRLGVHPRATRVVRWRDDPGPP